MLKKAILPLVLGVLGLNSVAHSAMPVPKVDASNAAISHIHEYQAGHITEREAREALWPDFNDFVEQNGLQLDVGTYGRNYGSDELKLQDLWAHLNPEKLQYFRMLLLYNVGQTGPLAQTVRVYTRPEGSRINLMDLNQWKLERTWKISSGIKFRTITGLYKINPSRVSLNARAWGANDPMPHAMYLHYKYCDQGRDTGIATHGTPFEAKLGQRASSGCLRLSRANAKELFEEVTTKYRGVVPQTNFCDGRRQAPGSQYLEMMRDSNGRVLTQQGYQVLFVIHDDANPAF